MVVDDAGEHESKFNLEGKEKEKVDNDNEKRKRESCFMEKGFSETIVKR